MVSWGGGLADELAPSYAPPNSGVLFLSCSKINPEIYHVFMDFGSQNDPQNGAKINKKQIPKPIQKPDTKK